MFFARLLAHRLREDAKVSIGSVERPADDAILPTGRVLHRIQTTLPAVMGRVNKDSQNMFAESLLKRMGRSLTGASGSWKNGPAAVLLSLRKRLGTSSASVNIADGSGMSRNNRVTARIIVKLLRSLHKDSDSQKAEIFRRSLAEAGVDGTLEDRLTKLEGATVYGKSGYLREVSALSGYIVFSDGNDETEADKNDKDNRPQHTIAFSFLFNGFKPPLYNHQMKQLQNDMVRTIVKSVTPQAQLGG